MNCLNYIKISLFFFYLIIFSWLFCNTSLAGFVDFRLEIPLLQNQTTVSSIGGYIKMIFIFGLGVVGIVGLFSAVWGGITYLTSGSSETRKLEGKRWIYAAASGIILLFFSYLIFTTLTGSQFTSLKEPSLEQISIDHASQDSGTTANPYKLEMPLVGTSQAPTNPGDYIKTFFIFGLGGVGLVALFVVIFGGIYYLISFGNASMKTYGKQWIIAAVSGLSLILCSYLILSTINPQLVNWNQKSLDPTSSDSSFSTPGTTANPYKLEMPLVGTSQAPTNPGDYIKTFFIFGLGGVGLVALFVVIFGGLNYIFSGSSQTRAMEGRRWITGAIAGVALLMLSFLILNTISPNLTSLRLNDLSKTTITSNPSGQESIGTFKNPYTLEMPLLGAQQSAKTPSEYLKIFFSFGLGMVGVVALFAVVFGGLNYIFSGSSQTRAMEGKRWITGAIAGVALLFCSYLILSTINQDLITYKDPELAQITIEPHMGLGFNLSIGEITSTTGQWSDLANKWGGAKNIPPALIQAMIGRESGGNSTASSPDGGKGLMQITSSSLYTRYNLQDPNNPDENVRVGVSYLSDLKNYFGGDITKAVSAYNCGTKGVETAVAKGGSDWMSYLPKGVNKAGVPYDTKAYTEKVLSTWKSIENK